MAASVRDVAHDAGVSVGTVSNVLNHPGKVSPATVERVTAAIERLGFVRNDAARQLRAGRS
ncbi:MAG: LacI family DNA-binding transcriptional regulator, partial [Actinobacteria bacterium]|nr:LacI family DNA-binding transcriptional regulator [Actinomycetota bacterium]